MSSLKFKVVALAALAIVGDARGQNPAQAPNLEGFTVTGKGSAGVRPNRLEIELEVSAASEMTADVIVKYRDARKRIQEAFAALKLGDVTIEERALSVAQKGQVFNPYMMDTPPARKGKVEVQLTRKLVVCRGNIREMDEESLLQLVAKLLDVAQDAGGKLGGQSNFNPYYYQPNPSGGGLVRFIVDDFDALAEKAYQDAIADARARAGRLAKLSGVGLGPVLGVREVLIPGEKPQQPASMSFYGPPSSNDDDEFVPRKRLESSKFHEIPIRVELQVRFASKAQGKEGGP